MTEELSIQRVEVSFVGTPPARTIARASGVSEVEVDGVVLRCLVLGSFQPFLEALRGYEVVSLTSTSEHPPSEPDTRKNSHYQQLREVNDETDCKSVAAL
jgi:hypothetical protein